MAMGWGGVVGLQQRQQEEHLRLSWHQVLLSCLNESNLPSPPRRLSQSRLVSLYVPVR